ncbi:MAG: hypothetical protein AAGD32_13725 [Planctomycetota bacterium]
MPLIEKPTHATMTPGFNFDAIKRHQKGLVKLNVGGIATPFYYVNEVVIEGQPLKVEGATAFLAEGVAANEAAKVIGLAMQMTYDAPTGHFAQLAEYNFANDTSQSLNGSPIGVLMGAGYAKTTNYTGDVTFGDPAYLDATGKILTADSTTGANGLLPIVFEGEGSDGDVPVTIRFDFPVVV